VRLLGVSDDLIEVMPNGVDTDLFERAALTRDERLGYLRHWLVDDPQGWDESGLPGSIRYPLSALDAFTGDRGELPPILLYVGRYLDFKRVPLLVRAYARAQPRFKRSAPLLIWGGSPGEWEGEHPYRVATELAVDGVFFSGWRGHDELPLGLSCADVFVGPSVDEPFGLVLLEAMSCGLPVITTATGGPRSFVNTVAGKPNGWLVAPDDVDALADALVEAVSDDAARNERAHHASQQIRGSYSWRALAGRFDALYTDLLDRASS
jgi:glycosyltransferase involved in cell wall biosynthesis